MLSSLAIAELPVHERPRERLFQHGPGALTDRELLAMILRTGSHQHNAVQLAMTLIAALGSLRDVSMADVDELRSVGGVGMAKASSVVASFELARRIPQREARRQLSSSEDIAEAAKPLLRGLRHERVVLILADAALRVLRTVVLTEGTGDRSLLPVRDALHVALRSGASAFAVAHNHPSGDLRPSTADREITQQLRTAAAVVDLRFLDHIITTDASWQSVG